ncbi:MAG: DNA adenine methylase [Solirubrobacteraceae bacterium]
MRLPHPIPYQGSKRALAPRILATVSGMRFGRLYEPFAGSSAITLAASYSGLADEYVMGDSLAPLMELWQRLVDDPSRTASEYETLWTVQLDDGREHFAQVREAFNRDRDPIKLLYLLARCVKNAPRFNKDGAFNQSADHRRRGMHPRKMRREMRGASELLRQRSEILVGDFEQTAAAATSRDLIYLDPPWEGTSVGPDKRYHEWLQRERLIAFLATLNAKDVPWILSYDGRHGEKTYGEPLPSDLGAERLELNAGRSSQATLNGQATITIESLYLSPQLASATKRYVQPSLLTNAA